MAWACQRCWAPNLAYVYFPNADAVSFGARA